MMDVDFKKAVMECHFYDEIGELNEDCIEEIAYTFNVDFEELKNKWEETYYE